METKNDATLKTAFVCDESYFWHNAGGGALYEQGEFIEELGSIESPLSKRRTKNLIERSGLMDELVQIKPKMATQAQLEWFHTKRHIDHVRELSATILGGECGDAAHVGAGSFEIAKMSAGGAIAAVHAVVQKQVKNAYALTRPPGHHAQADCGGGFCIFNNAVIAAKYAQNELGIKKIAIIDWDAHHGNGVEDAFYNDDTVLFISLHQEGYDPVDRGLHTDTGSGAGKGFNINIPLYAGSGDAVYKYAFEQIVIPKVKEFAPELIIICAGQDANFFDPLARMMVTSIGYRYMTRALMDFNVPMVCLHEGGYCPTYVPFCTHAIIEELSGITTKAGDPYLYSMEGTSFNKLLPHQKERIDTIKAYLEGENGLDKK